MTKFEKIFGMAPKDVKENCVLAPMVNKEILDGFGVKTLKRGKLYGTANTKNFTFIHTGMNSVLVGDAVLYLKETACKNLFLFGSCGSSGVLEVGTLVVPTVAYADEGSAYPDKILLERFVEANNIKTAICQTVSSLKTEEEKICDFRNKGVDILDMECFAFFNAAKHSKLRLLALFYVSDIVIKKPYYESLSAIDQKAVNASIKEGTNVISRGLISLFGVEV